MIALALLLLLSTVNARHNGAPIEACQTMLPSHGKFSPQLTTSPYEITALHTSDHVLVTIKSTLALPFKGVLLQARTQNDQLTGTFEPINNDVHAITCDKTNDTITHNDSSPKSSVDVKWKSPSGYQGLITFHATVVQKYDTFWAGIKSQALEIEGDGQNTTEELPEETTIPQNEFDPFYEGCDQTKTCFGYPDGCVLSQNCKGVVAVTPANSDRYEIELKGVGEPKWIGFGLSHDAKMGDDSVVECVKEDTAVKAYMSWTTSGDEPGVFRLPNPQEGIELVSGSYVDGTLRCRVLRNVKTIVNNEVFDLENNEYYLLVASGTRMKDNSVGWHDLGRLPSATSVYLSETNKIKGASKLLIQLHGAFMLTAWIGTASIGTFLARYYKKTWVGKSLCGKDLWFAFHRFLMVLTWALTSVAFVLIFVELRAWSTENNPHAILGCVVTCLCFIQPIGAFFRPHPGTPKRPIFNWLHWLGGNSAHIIAIITVFFAVRLSKAELPAWFDWILVAFVVFHALMHLLLSILGCASENSSKQRISSYPMKLMSGSEQVNVDAPYSSTRRLLLALYILVVAALTITLVVVVVLAPFES